MRRHARMFLATALAWMMGLGGLGAAPATPTPTPLPPVFRHALEQCSAADYDVVVFHRGSMDDDAQRLVDDLEHARAQSGANTAVRTVDVAGAMDKSMEELWTCQNSPQPPWIVVRAPEASPEAAPVWTGSLTASAVSALLDSPARRKIAEALLRGSTAVWVLLECGESVRDEAAVDVLSSALKSLEKKMSLAPSGPLRSPLPLHIDFDLVRVTRSDPAEEFFVTLLEHGKPVFSSRPVAFPVFGRGRTLGALVGREIDPEGIASVCSLLTASIREGQANPGRDLLLAADWKKLFEPLPAGQQGKPKPPGPPVVAAVASPGVEQEGSGYGWMILVGGVVVGVGALVFLLPRKRA